MAEYLLEILAGDRAITLEPVADDTGVQLSPLKQSLALEVGGFFQMPWQIGGPDPTSNPAVLVWFDTQGAL